MYSVFRQTDKSTAIEHALYCHFFNNRDKQLIACGGSHLRVFRINPHVIESSSLLEYSRDENILNEADGNDFTGTVQRRYYFTFILNSIHFPNRGILSDSKDQVNQTGMFVGL